MEAKRKLKEVELGRFRLRCWMKTKEGRCWEIEVVGGLKEAEGG